jgi:DNA-binding response OmpR family regulator
MKPRILIMEDDRAVYRSLARMLEGKDYELVWTQTGHEALRRSLDEPFDAALLDLNVSDIDSAKAVDLLCRFHPFLPVLMLADEYDLRGENRMLGADALLKKPVNCAELLRALDHVLAESHHDRISRVADALYDTVTAP